jgi:hypothetical protein
VVENQPPFSRDVSALVRNNLKNWDMSYYLIFFILLPLINILIFVLPDEIKSDFFIFHTSELFRLPSYLLSSYTHVEFYPHLVSNLVVYCIAVFVIFAFENNRKRFNKIAILALFFVPVIISGSSVIFWHFVGKNMDSLGFSGVVETFLAYALIIGLTGNLGNSLEMLDHPEMFEGHIWIFYSVSVLITVAIAAIVLVGEIAGFFILSGNSISNGLAHFIGYNIGLIAFLIIDIYNEKRKYVDIMIAFSIIIGIVSYFYYLTKLFQ